MRLTPRSPLSTLGSLAALSLALSACADPLAPTPSPSPAVVGSFPALPADAELQATIVSNGSTAYCGYTAATDGTGGTTGAAADCAGTATDLTAALAVYNPGWNDPLAGTAWIGTTDTYVDELGATHTNVPTNYYSALPGTRTFKADFTLDADVTDPILRLEVKADNDVFVYLNDQLVGRHTPIADDQNNWLSSLLIDGTVIDLAGNPTGADAWNIGGVNTLRVDLIGTRINAPFPAPVPPGCVVGVAPTGPANGVLIAPGVVISAANYDEADCRNPTGVSFKALIYAMPEIGDEGCTPGYWKQSQHFDSWPAGYTPGTLVSSLFDGAGSGTLLDALQGGGGKGVEGAKSILLRAAVAATLNAASDDVDYTMTVDAIKDDVEAALASGNRDTMLALAAELDADNNLGCPLN